MIKNTRQKVKTWRAKTLVNKQINLKKTKQKTKPPVLIATTPKRVFDLEIMKKI